MNKRLKERSVTYYEIIFTYFVKFATLKRLTSDNMFSTFSRSPLIRCKVYQLKHTQVTLQFSLKGPHFFSAGEYNSILETDIFPCMCRCLSKQLNSFQCFLYPLQIGRVPLSLLLE